MANRAVARRYAKGLLRAVLEIGSADQGPELLADQIDALASTVRSHAGLRLLIVNPAIGADKKTAVLEQVAVRLGLGDIAQRFLRLLAEKERLVEIQGIAQVFRELVDQHLGIVNAEITTPAALDEATAARLRAGLERATGNTVRLAMQTDPEILGGVVTRIGDILYDGSLRHQLARMGRRMMEG